MNRPITFLFLLCAVTAGNLPAKPPPVTLSLVENWQNAFGGQNATFQIKMIAQEDFSGRLTWRLSAAGRTLSRGERGVQISARHTETATISVPLPPVNPGVVYASSLTIALTKAGADTAVQHIEHPIRAFPADPFHGQEQWLADLNIHLFDPVGATAQRFEDLGLNLTRIHNLNRLAELESGIIITGAGLSFLDYPGLAALLQARAACGVTVLCLAPATGAFELADPDAGNKPERIIFRRADVIHEWDKRLDATAWPPDGRVSSSGAVLQSDRNRVIAAIETEGWPWIEMRFANGGRLILCGFAIVAKWDMSPTPRFLLARMLEWLDAGGNKNRKE